MTEISKEIIKELGWIQIGGFWYEWPTKEIDIPEYSSRGLDFRLCFSGRDRYSIMTAYERNIFDWETVFSGPLKTKEELEFLMKIFKLC